MYLSSGTLVYNETMQACDLIKSKGVALVTMT